MTQTTVRYKYFILDPELFTPGRDSLGMKHDYDNNLGKRLERVPDMPFYPAGLWHFFFIQKAPVQDFGVYRQQYPTILKPPIKLCFLGDSSVHNLSACLSLETVENFS